MTLNLQNKHAVTIAEKAVFFGEGVFATPDINPAHPGQGANLDENPTFNYPLPHEAAL